MSVYVDDCFVEGDWGRWTGGGHMQADTLEELHEFAERLGLKRAWFQSRPERPGREHYDLMRGKRELALRLGAVAETSSEGALRRRAGRPRQYRQHVPGPNVENIRSSQQAKRDIEPIPKQGKR